MSDTATPAKPEPTRREKRRAMLAWVENLYDAHQAIAADGEYQQFLDSLSQSRPSERTSASRSANASSP
jgi:hypothetical protein